MEFYIYGFVLRSNSKISLNKKQGAVLKLKYDNKYIFIIPLILVPIIKKDEEVREFYGGVFKDEPIIVKQFRKLMWEIEWRKNSYKRYPKIRLEFITPKNSNGEN